MLLLKAQAVTKTFGARTLFEFDQLEIHDGARIGLVGNNGAGKSTLLHLLYGDLPCDEGLIERRCEIALVEQSGDSDGTEDGRLLRELSLTGSACKSGGERTRLALAAAFAQNTPLLFADEPTTNLDLAGIETLQKMLTDYPGALVLISHDRVLLDALCTAIWAIEDQKVRVFSGNYSAWIAQQERERDFAQFEYDQYRAEKKRLEQEVRRLREQASAMSKTPARMGNSEARLHKREFTVPQAQIFNRASNILNRAGRLEKDRPGSLPEVRMTLGAAHPVTSKIAARVEGLTVRYGRHTVLNGAGFTLPTGTHTVMLGGNGTGKTTAAMRLVHGVTVCGFPAACRSGISLRIMMC